jgi:predicted DNA binding protein
VTAIADVSIPADEFELGTLVQNYPGMEVELERIVPVREGFLPFFWVSGANREGIEETLLSSPDVESIDLLTELEDRSLYQVIWHEDINGFIESLVTSNGTVLEGSGNDTEWNFRLRFTSHGELSTFGTACERKGIDLEVLAVYNPHPVVRHGGLTPDQRETLKIAHDRGFFEVPRRTSLPELAEHFDISKQAVSQRLRRGLNNLLFEIDL